MKEDHIVQSIELFAPGSGTRKASPNKEGEGHHWCKMLCHARENEAGETKIVTRLLTGVASGLKQNSKERIQPDQALL